jgi:hypothetical protein
VPGLDPLSAAIGGAVVKGISRILTFRSADIGVCHTRVVKFGWLPWDPKVLVHPMADGTHEQRWVGRPPRRRRRTPLWIRRALKALLVLAVALAIAVALVVLNVVHVAISF